MEKVRIDTGTPITASNPVVIKIDYEWIISQLTQRIEDKKEMLDPFTLGYVYAILRNLNAEQN